MTLSGEHRAILFAGCAATGFEHRAFAGDLERWRRGLASKGWEDTTLLGPGAGSRAALLDACRQRVAETEEEDVLWIVLSNHGDQDVDEMGRKRGVCTSEPEVFVSSADFIETLRPCHGVVALIAGHCGAGQFARVAEACPRVVVCAGCGPDQFARVREGHLELLLWLAAPLFDLGAENVAAMSPTLPDALARLPSVPRSLQEAWDFAVALLPSRQPGRETYQGTRTPVQTTPVLYDPSAFAPRIVL